MLFRSGPFVGREVLSMFIVRGAGQCVPRCGCYDFWRRCEVGDGVVADRFCAFLWLGASLGSACFCGSNPCFLEEDVGAIRASFSGFRGHATESFRRCALVCTRIYKTNSDAKEPRMQEPRSPRRLSTLPRSSEPRSQGCSEPRKKFIGFSTLLS